MTDQKKDSLDNLVYPNAMMVHHVGAIVSLGVV